MSALSSNKVSKHLNGDLFISLLRVLLLLLLWLRCGLVRNVSRQFYHCPCDALDLSDVLAPFANHPSGR